MSFRTLHRLRGDARTLVTDAFMRGEVERVGDSEVGPYLEEVEPAVELGALDEAVDELLDEFPPRDPRLDAAAGPRLYEALPLDRRAASDPGVWRFLAVVHRPDFVRHRWEFATRATTLPRYWQFGTRPNSNAFARLWWITELSFTDGDYRRTRTLLQQKTLANAIFVRSFSRYPPAVAACSDALADADAAVIEETLRRLNSRLSTVVVEGRDYDALLGLVTRIREGVESERDAGA